MTVKPNQAIGTLECPDCGSTVAVKVNKNLCVYCDCRARIEADELCYYRERHGRVASRRIIEAYEASKGPTDAGPRDHVSEPREPEPEPEPAVEREPEREPEPEPDAEPGWRKLLFG